MKFAFRTLLPCVVLLSMPGFASAQEVDAFLACAEITDRQQRLICLDEALDEATSSRGESVAAPTGEPAPVESLGETAGRVTETREAQSQEAQARQEEAQEANAERESIFRLPRIGIFRRGDNDGDDAEEAVVEAEAGDGEEGRLESFGRQARVVVNENGEDELHDSIAELLMARPNQWLIRLASGQVWRQVHPKRLNLREGDEVRIYPTGWGDNFRLETPRLAGYIQVVRVEE